MTFALRGFQYLAALTMLLPGSPVLVAQTVTDPNLSISVLASGFSQPTGMTFLGSNPNDFFVIEKASGLVKHWNSGSVSTALSLTVDSNSERGVLGITLDPQFNTTRPYGYVYYSQQVAGSWTENRLSRFTWNGTAFNAASEVRLLAFPSDGRDRQVSTIPENRLILLVPRLRLGTHCNSGSWRELYFILDKPSGTMPNDEVNH